MDKIEIDLPPEYAARYVVDRKRVKQLEKAGQIIAIDLIDERENDNEMVK